MTNPERIDIDEATNQEKLTLLSEVFRIALFVSPSDDHEDNQFGYTGRAFNSEGEISAHVAIRLQYGGQNLHDESSIVHLAGFERQADTYDFYAVRDVMKYLDCLDDSLSESLYQLHQASSDNVSAFPLGQAYRELIGPEPAFKAQTIAVFKNLPRISEYKSAIDQDPHAYRADMMIGALATNDFEAARRLLEDTFVERPVTIDQLRELEMAQAEQVSGDEIRQLQQMLAQSYLI